MSEDPRRRTLHACGRRHQAAAPRAADGESLAALGAVVGVCAARSAVDKRERGIELRRPREGYFQIAGYLVRAGRTLLVRLSGVAVGALRRRLWRNAFAAAGPRALRAVKDLSFMVFPDCPD